MKKVLVLFAVFMLTLTLAACGEECQDCSVLPEIPADLMLESADFDDYLGRADVQYVDLRNFDDKLNGGYVSGFEMIPFFDYLEYEGYMDREGNVLDTAVIENLFDKDATAIFLMCGSGTRAGWVKDALDAAGYDNVMNVGGITAYAGDNKVLGDGTYVLDPLPMLPEVVDMTNIDSYLDRPDVQYVDLRDFDDKMNGGYIAGFEMIPFFNYLEYNGIMDREGNVADSAAVANLFDKDAEAIFLMCGSGTRAGWVLDALVAEGYTNAYNIGGIGTYVGDNKVLGDDEFVLEHPASGDFIPGTYQGHDGGYVVTIVVGDGGAIEVVALDAAHFVYGTDTFISMKRAYLTPEEYDMNYSVNDNGTPLDDTDDFLELDAGKLDWWMQADALEAAVLTAQGWDGTWTLDVDGKFDADEVAGVSITVSHWMNAIDDAVAQATPAS